MIVSTLCYIEHDEKILMLYRNKKENDLNEGKWVGVGGKLQEGETVDQCVCREVLEETGLSLTSYELRGVIKFISDKWEDEDMYLYYADDFEGELLADCNEGELHWIEKSKVLDLPTWEGDRIFLTPFFAGEKDIDISVKYEGDTLADSIVKTEKATIVKSDCLKSPHGFSTRIGGVSEGDFESLNLRLNGEDDKYRVAENWRRFLNASGIDKREFVCGQQMHGNDIYVASSKDMKPSTEFYSRPEADGYVTNEKGVPLAVFTADCVPVLLEDTKNGVIGAVHCGWRSTVADIQKNAIEKMIELGADVENIKVAIGPAINQCCFEVGGEVIEAVKKLLDQNKDASASIVAIETSKGLSDEKNKKITGIASNFYTERGDKYMLDLKGVVRERFLQLGLLPENIELVGWCTRCNPDMYWSHRYRGNRRGSQASVIMLAD